MDRVITGPGSPDASASWPGPSSAYRLWRPSGTQHLDFDAPRAEDVQRAAQAGGGDLGLHRSRKCRGGPRERLPRAALLLSAHVVAVRPLQQPQSRRECEQPQRLADQHEQAEEAHEHVTDEHRQLGVQHADDDLAGRGVAVQRERHRGQTERDDQIRRRARDQADVHAIARDGGVAGDRARDDRRHLRRPRSARPPGARSPREDDAR
jgi:hypothetical protein